MPQAVIMAGGIGERFWPLTSSDFPKYRIRHDGRSSLLQATFKRLSGVYGAASVHVITGKDHVRHIRAELTGLRSGNLHVEPYRNNTASAIHLTCEILRERCGADEVVSFFPADHLIRNQAAFKTTLERAIGLASKTGRLVTIGIRPTFAATGYGYIERGTPLKGASRAYAVARFVIEILRRDDRGGGLGLSTSQLIGLALVAAAIAVHKVRTRTLKEETAS